MILPSSPALAGSSASAGVGGTSPHIGTPSQTVGPYFRIGEEWLYQADLTGGAEGPRLTVSGRVLDERRTDCVGAAQTPVQAVAMLKERLKHLF